MSAGLLHAEAGDWKSASKALRIGVEQLPRFSLQSLPRSDQEHGLGGIAKLSSTAATASLLAGLTPSTCLELLEWGCGVMAGILIRRRSDISDLQTYRPGLWAKYEEAREALSNPFSLKAASEILGQESTPRHILLMSEEQMIPVSSAAIERSHRTAQQMEEIEAEVRTMDGFAQFQRPPDAQGFISLGEKEPVVSFNISEFRADAFIVWRGDIGVLELPDFDLAGSICERCDRRRPSLPWPAEHQDKAETGG